LNIWRNKMSQRNDLAQVMIDILNIFLINSGKTGIGLTAQEIIDCNFIDLDSISFQEVKDLSQILTSLTNRVSISKNSLLNFMFLNSLAMSFAISQEEKRVIEFFSDVVLIASDDEGIKDFVYGNLELYGFWIEKRNELRKKLRK